MAQDITQREQSSAIYFCREIGGGCVPQEGSLGSLMKAFFCDDGCQFSLERLSGQGIERVTDERKMDKGRGMEREKGRREVQSLKTLLGFQK